MSSLRHVIEIGKLVKRWPNGRGVYGIDLTVSPGEVVGFLGPTARARRPQFAF